MRTLNSTGPVNLLLVALTSGLLTGCAGSFAPGPVTPEQVSIGNIQGKVHGGNLPISGSAIYLYQTSSSGYGTAATSLICNSSIDTNACPTVGAYGPFKDSNGNYYIMSDSTGAFSLGGDYSCTENSQVYMIALGGNPGLQSIATTATFSKNSNTITVASATNINVGASVSGTGVSGYVTAVSGTKITLSQQNSAAGSNASVSFSVYNPAIVQMVGLGQCPSVGTMADQVPFLTINEVTTVAFAYAMGGFATTPYNISADAGGAAGLANAMNNFSNVVNLVYGQAYTLSAPGNTNSIPPASRINTLANILAACVNQANSTASPCTNLFKYATTESGTQATDEGSAIFNIVHNQAVQIASGTTVTQNATNLYNLMNGNEPFSPYLASAPTDWTMPIIYNTVISKPVTSSNKMTSGPYNIVFDASGDAWIGDRINGVVEIGPQGAVKTFSNASEGFGMVKGVAVSPEDGKLWVSDFGNNKIDVMEPNGTIDTTITQHMTSNTAGPVSTVFALNPLTSGDYMAYEVNETVPGIVVFDAGAYTGTTPALHYAGNTNSPEDFLEIAAPGWIYVDSTGTVWMPSTNTEYAGEFTVADKSGTVKYGPSDPLFGASYTIVPEQLGMAADGLGNVWAAATISDYGTGLYELKAGSNEGTSVGGGLNTPYKTFVDGSNSIWVANGGANTVSAYNPSTTSWLSSVGFSTDAAAGTGCLVIGVDPSGDVWTGNSDQSVSVLLGLAAPTAAPLYGGQTVGTTATNGNLGTRP